MKSEFIYIFLGGGIGSTLRYSMQLLFQERMMVYPFPWTTFSVNIIGSLLIGIFYGLSSHFNFSTETRLFLTTGLCGGFTTFSTFSYESMQLLKQGYYGTLFFYLILSLVLGISAAVFGAFLVEKRFF